MLKKKDILKFLKGLGKGIDNPITIYLFGGESLTLRDVKKTTRDIDIVLSNNRDFKIIEKSMRKVGFDHDETLLDERGYVSAVAVFKNRTDNRVDIFVKTICSALDFSEDMKKRAIPYDKFGKLAVKMASNEDTFLFKSITEREKDIVDCKSLIDRGINWKIILKECVAQEKRAYWRFWLYEQICRIENMYKIKIPIKSKIKKLCDKMPDKRPNDFMEEI